MVENNAYNYLSDHGIRPSVQRVAIMDYLLKNRVHPTAELVYKAISKKMPILSKTTVYNTLNAFAEAGAVTPITIDSTQVRFDVDTTPHAHFLCKECGSMVDLPNVSVQNAIGVTEIDGNSIEEVHLYYKGVCRACQHALQKEKTNNND